MMYIGISDISKNILNICQYVIDELMVFLSLFRFFMAIHLGIVSHVQ